MLARESVLAFSFPAVDKEDDEGVNQRKEKKDGRKQHNIPEPYQRLSSPGR